MKQNFIKAEMSLQILQNTFKSENVELIQMDQKDKDLIQWIDENEFMYKGRMYDLISQQFVGNQIKIYAIQDSKEASLESEFKTFIFSLMDQKGGKGENSISSKLFEKDFYYEELNFILSFLKENKLDSNTNYHFSNLSVYSEITSPPPRYSFQLYQFSSWCL
jgi:hypothetical protein